MINNIRYTYPEDSIASDSASQPAGATSFYLGKTYSKYFSDATKALGTGALRPPTGRGGLGYQGDGATGPVGNASAGIKFNPADSGSTVVPPKSNNSSDFLGSAMKSLNPFAVASNAVGGILQGVSSLQGQNLARDKWQAQMNAARSAGFDTPEQLNAQPTMGVLRGGTIASVPRGGRGYMN